MSAVSRDGPRSESVGLSLSFGSNANYPEKRRDAARYTGFSFALPGAPRGENFSFIQRRNEGESLVFGSGSPRERETGKKAFAVNDARGIQSKSRCARSSSRLPTSARVASVRIIRVTSVRF